MSSKTRHRRRWRRFRALSRATKRLIDARLNFQRAKGAAERMSTRAGVERAQRMMQQAKDTGLW